MGNDDIRVTGNHYEIRAYRLDDGTWATYGYYHDLEIDSLWCDVAVTTLQELEDLIIDAILGA